MPVDILFLGDDEMAAAFARAGRVAIACHNTLSAGTSEPPQRPLRSAGEERSAFRLRVAGEILAGKAALQAAGVTVEYREFPEVKASGWAVLAITTRDGTYIAVGGETCRREECIGISWDSNENDHRFLGNVYVPQFEVSPNRVAVEILAVILGHRLR
jgi:hypothetical protein